MEDQTWSRYRWIGIKAHFEKAITITGMSQIKLYMYGNIDCRYWTRSGIWLGLGDKACNGPFGWIRYLFNSPSWTTGIRYFLLTHELHARCRMEYNYRQKQDDAFLDDNVVFRIHEYAEDAAAFDAARLLRISSANGISSSCSS